MLASCSSREAHWKTVRVQIGVLVASASYYITSPNKKVCPKLFKNFQVKSRARTVVIKERLKASKRNKASQIKLNEKLMNEERSN